MTERQRLPDRRGNVSVAFRFESARATLRPLATLLMDVWPKSSCTVPASWGHRCNRMLTTRRS